MTTFKRLICQTIQSQTVSKRIWFDQRYLASISSSYQESHSTIETLGINLLPPHFWPKREDDPTFAYFLIGGQAPVGAPIAFTPAGQSIWVNSASVLAMEVIKDNTRLYFIPPAGGTVQSTGLVVLRPANMEDVGHFDKDSSPTSVAKMLNIQLEN